MTRGALFAIASVGYLLIGAYSFFFELRPMLTGRPQGSPAQPAQPTARLSCRQQDGVFTLRGELPDETAKLVLTRTAVATFGESNVESDLTANLNLPPAEWCARASDLFIRMRTGGWFDAGLDVDRGKAVLVGLVETELERTSIAQGALVALPGLKIENRLRVAPASGPEIIQAKIHLLLFTGRIAFEPAGDVILPESAPLLDEIAVLIKRESGVSVEIAVHTSIAGQALSQRRADALRAYLIARGVSPTRARAMGHGNQQPRVPLEHPNSSKRNNRVEFRVSGA